MPITDSAIHARIHLTQLMDYRNPRADHVEIIEPTYDDERASRGNLYILIEMIGASPVSSYAVREMQSVIELTYYSASGPVSAVLERAIASAHETLRDLNRRSPDIDLEAGIICAAIVQGHLVIASAGPPMALIATAHRLDQFPLDADRYTGPVGRESQPNIHVYRHKLNSGDALFLGESEWVLLSDIRTIGGAVANASVSNMQDMVVHLREQGENMPLLGLLLVYSEQAGEASEPETAAFSRLPAAVGATPPVRDMPGEEGRRNIVPFQSRRGGAIPRLPSAPTMEHQLAVPFRPFMKLRGPWYKRAFRLLGRPRKWMSGLLQGLLPERQAQQSDPVERDAGAQTAAVASRQVERDASAQTAAVASRPTRESESDGTAATSQPAPQPAERIQLPALPGYAPPEPTKGNRRRLILSIAILIPLLTSAVVGAAFLREGSLNQEEGVQLVQLADSQLLQVQQALAVDDRATARASLSEAQRNLDEAIVLIGVTEQIQEMSEVIATELQELLQVRALYSLDVPMLEYPAEADPHRIIVSDQDIYVLDSSRQWIEHYRTNSERTLLEENNGAVLKEGDVVSGVTVGRLVDIAWQPRIAGFADKASLLILDRSNNVFRYNRLDGATHLQLAGQSSLGSIGQVALYNGRLYLADERENQIFRYEPAGLAYDETPVNWFDEQVQGDLSGLVAMGIDGDIWLLTEDGTLLRYRQGQQLPFSLERIPGLGGLLVDLALDEQGDGTLYLADATEERILVYDKEGRYIEQYVDAEDMALAGLRGLYLDEFSGILYILTSSALYAHPLPR